MPPSPPHRLTARAFFWGAVVSALFAALTVFVGHRRGLYVTSTQIPVLPYVLLFASVLVINPLCRLLRIIRPFSLAEILTVFIMGSVSAGISTFGLSAQLIPISGSLFNSAWYNDQTKWNLYIAPHVNDRFFLAEDGLQLAAREYADAIAAAKADTDNEPARLQRDAARANLAALEARAFAKVDLFRRGLPRDMRAIPGLIPSSSDSVSTYRARVQRLLHGRRSLDALDAASRALLQHHDADAADHLAHAREALIPVSDLAPLRQQLQHAEQDLAALRREAADLDARLTDFYAEARVNAAERNRIQAALDRAHRRATELDRERKTANSRIESLQREINSTQSVADMLVTLADLENRVRQSDPQNVAAEIPALAARYRLFDASLDRFLVGDIPWLQWWRPLSRWGLLIGVTYLVLLCLNVLVFRQWAHHEKLTFPLADLPESIAGLNDPSPGRIPRLFTDGAFWTGLAISASVLSWNLLCSLDLIPGLTPLNLDIVWRPYIEQTPLQALLPSTRSTIFFTMIGLSFLAPPRISFSLWFFHVIFLLQLLALVWMGHGVNSDSFPSEWWFTMNFRTAQGGGAILVFSAVVLYKCRQYLFCCFHARAIRDLEPDERIELRAASALFLSGTVLLITLLSWGLGAGVPASTYYVLVALMISVGLVRAVAEGGILAFQAWANPFHFIRTLVGFDKSWTSPALFTPLMIYHSIMFLDVKTFIAPAMANALKIRSDLRLSRARFHAAIAVAIAVAAVVAVTTELVMAYSTGANELGDWFYNQFPKVSTYGFIAQTATAPPAASAADRLWIVAGAALMGTLLILRQFLFWLPHPIGLIMFVSPLMTAYWFSILVGWLAKSTISRYGSRDLYARARLFFIGLIVGELILVALAMLLPFLFDIRFDQINIDLNKSYL